MWKMYGQTTLKLNVSSLHLCLSYAFQPANPDYCHRVATIPYNTNRPGTHFTVLILYISLGNFGEKLQSIVFAVLHLNMSFHKSVHMEDTKLFINPVCTIKQ